MKHSTCLVQIIGVVSLLLASFASSADEDSLTSLMDKAEHGDVAAKIALGSEYFAGGRLDRNFTDAAKWIGKAAATGDAHARKDFAWLCYLGAGTARDFVAASAAASRAANASGIKFTGLEWFTAANWPREFGEQGDYIWATALSEVDLDSAQPEKRSILADMGLSPDGVQLETVSTVPWLTAFAEKGDRAAQYALGQYYLRSTGPAKENDLAQGVEWITKSAAQGYPRAQVLLGNMYFDGIGVPKDETKTVEWFTKAAAQGDELGQFCLSMAYTDGKGVPKDEAKGAEYMAKSMAQGDLGALIMYVPNLHAGIGVAKDEAKAKALLEDAIDQDSKLAVTMLQILQSDMTAEQISQESAARKIYRDADRGDRYSQGKVAEAYKAKGDIDKAIHYYTLAADQGEPFSAFMLGKMYLLGDGVPKDYARAESLFSKVAESQYLSYLMDIGQLYEGQLHPQTSADSAPVQDPPIDLGKAYLWYNIAAAKGLSEGGVARNRLENQMKPEEITAAQKASTAWMKQHAKPAAP